MPLLRTRPRVRLRAPRDVVPGRPFDVAVLLDAEREVEIEWCDLALAGRLVWGEEVRTLATLAGRVSERRVLSVGTTELPCRMTLPADAPRSHPGPATRVVYEVSVHASIPWWPDARSEFALHVVAPPSEPVAGTPRVGVSRIEGPQAGSPYAEIAIGTDTVEVGGVIDGTFVLRDVGRVASRVALALYEERDGVMTRVGAWSVALDRPGSFAFRVPDDLTPTTRMPGLDLVYRLEGEARGRFGPVVSASLPIRLVDPGGLRGARRVVPPHVGEARLLELFTSVGAAEGARVESGPTLVVERGGVLARASRELTRDGTRLTVRVEMPSLHLGLHVHEPALAALSVQGRATARRAGLSPRCVVRARDPSQAAVLVARIAGLLRRARAIEMTDTTLRYAIATPANDRASVGRVVRDMAAIAEALALAPPMPTALVDSASAWRALAERLAGTLEPGHARVVAAGPDASVEVVTLFDDAGTPSGTLVSVRPALELRLEQPVTTDAEGIAEATAARLAPGAREALGRLARFGHVRVDAEGIRVTLDAPLGAGLAPDRASEIVAASLGLAVALRPTRGPFR